MKSNYIQAGLFNFDRAWTQDLTGKKVRLIGTCLRSGLAA